MALKFGLFEYDTDNIGDEIQSIAARRFLPRVDYWFNRDNIDATKNIKKEDSIKLIMNGWYTHKPENWPPKNQNIAPLLISMFVERRPGPDYSEDAFLSESSKVFLKKFGPVGTRDKATFEFLRDNNIDAYFSGCLTLTLIPDPKIERRDFVLAVDISDKVYDKIKSLTERTIIRIDTMRAMDLNKEEKFALAKYWLFLYQSAHLVITTRLHCMLPCLALETPVLAISSERDPSRYRGLIDLTNHATEDGFLSDDFSYNFENAPQNPKDYKKIRSAIEKKCQRYTKYDSKKSFLFDQNPDSLIFDPALISAIGKLASISFDNISTTSQNNQLQKELEQLGKRLEQTEKALALEKQKNADLLDIGVKGALQNLLTTIIKYTKKKF